MLTRFWHLNLSALSRPRIDSWISLIGIAVTVLALSACAATVTPDGFCVDRDKCPQPPLTRSK